MATFIMPPDVRIGPPILRVRDLEKELSFYQKGLHLDITRRYSDHNNNSDDDENKNGFEVIELGFKEHREPLLILKHDRDAKETLHNFAGLYHFAILVPDRRSLASAYVALENSGIGFEGFGDHLVSESLYLHDPERNGIEIYRDRPMEEWPRDKRGQIVMDTLPLDLGGILEELPRHDGNGATVEAFPNGAKIGHVHLRVTNLGRSLAFYNDGLGFQTKFDFRAYGAEFVAAGDYHHHIGMNTWHSLDGSPHKNGEAGLDEFVITLPRESALHTLEERLESSVIMKRRESGELLVSDPDGIRISIRGPRRELY